MMEKYFIQKNKMKTSRLLFTFDVLNLSKIKRKYIQTV